MPAAAAFRILHVPSSPGPERARPAGNQAIIPKVVVVLGLVLSQLSVLMLPLDRANRAACDASIVLSACNLTLPMYELWYWVYMVMVVVIIFVIPFTMFFYEADSEKCVQPRAMCTAPCPRFSHDLNRFVKLLFMLPSPGPRNIFARLWEAGQWWFVCVVVFAIILAVCYCANPPLSPNPPAQQPLRGAGPSAPCRAVSVTGARPL